MPRIEFGAYAPAPLTFREVPESRAMRAAIAAVQAEARNAVARTIKARARQFIARPTWTDIPLPGLRELPVTAAIERCRDRLCLLTGDGTRDTMHRNAIDLRAAELALRFARRWEYRRAELERCAPEDEPEAFEPYTVHLLAAE